ncbi:PAS domain S-box protein [Deinococcus sp. Arct2-2]|uniref:sensor histidine kinase n=1 Tax=Deinococcus sp. Arct2-2 TaxID=2568653 RepID=UPI0010A4F1A7|nr:ATP-binding protein [Deinococcus sp. Arct2-2]THF68704.1 PAS domain S-box protein [Deinococcus sp. Arct2-2]
MNSWAAEQAELEARVVARTRELEERSAALDAFVAFTEAVGTETDVLVLARQAIDVVRAALSGVSVAYFERSGPLWKARAWSSDVTPEVIASLLAGIPVDAPTSAEALATRAPVFVNGWNAALEGAETTQDYGAAVFFPYFLEDQPHSLLAAGTQQAHTWTDQEQAVIRAVGRGLGLALERAAQASQLERQNAELDARSRALEGFAHLTRDLSIETDPYTLIKRGQEVVMSLLPDGYALYYERAQGLWRNQVQTGQLGNDELQAVIDAGFPYTVPQSLVIPWVTGQPLYQDQYAQGSDTPPELVQHVSTAASLPVYVNGSATGIICFVLFGQRTWTSTDRVVMETVVHHLGLALERAGVVAQLEHRTEELARERTFLRAVLGSLSEGIVACDPEGRLTLFNDATRTFHGMDASPLPAEDWAEHYDLYEGDGVTPLLTQHVPLFRALSGERIQGAEMVIRPKGQAARRIVASGQAIFSENGNPLGAVVAMHDVTQRKEAEESVLRANEELRRSNAELEQFAYIASHDLQAPIRAVTSFAGMIARRYGDVLDERGQLYLRQIVDSGEHMKRLVDDLLTFSRIHTEQRQQTPVDSQGVFDEVTRRLQIENEAGAEVRAEGLPTVRADRQQLDQLLQNLISNGLKYRREGVVAQVRVSAERDGPVWRFAVTDNGIGIEPQYFGRIFEIFQRLHSRETYDGTGIGLAVCKKIVERHGGQVWLESVVGAGTTFFFTLPAAEIGPQL